MTHRPIDDGLEPIRREMEQRPTEELVSILRNRDEDEWRPEVFEIVASILQARGVSAHQVAALGPEGTDVVESQPVVTVGRFLSPAVAHTARMALENAGLQAWIDDEAGGTLYGPGIGARLQVFDADADAARAILAQEPVTADELPADLGEPACPACGSRRVAPEAWVLDPSEEERADSPDWGGSSRRKWHYVCADCREAWPA
jgi:hypothetical protein